MCWGAEQVLRTGATFPGGPRAAGAGDRKGRARQMIYGDCWEAGAPGGDGATCPSPRGVQEQTLQMRGSEAGLLPT